MSNNRRGYQYKDKYFEFVETEHGISIYEILSANCKVEKKFIINLGKSQPLKEYRKEELYVEWYLSSIDLETYSLGRRDGRNKISFLTFDSYLQWLLRSHQTKDVLVNPHLERELDWTYTYLVESENNRDIDFSLLSQINLKNTHNLITKNLLGLHNKDIRNASKYLTQFQERREREWLVYLTEETQYTKLLTQLKENILQSNYTPFLELSETDLEFYCKDTLDVILGKKVLDIGQGLKSEWSVFAHSTLLNTPLFFNKELNCFITLLEQSCYNYFGIPTYNFYKSLNTKWSLSFNKDSKATMSTNTLSLKGKTITSIEFGTDTLDMTIYNIIRSLAHEVGHLFEHCYCNVNNIEALTSNVRTGKLTSRDYDRNMLFSMESIVEDFSYYSYCNIPVEHKGSDLLGAIDRYDRRSRGSYFDVYGTGGLLVTSLRNSVGNRFFQEYILPILEKFKTLEIVTEKDLAKKLEETFKLHGIQLQDLGELLSQSINELIETYEQETEEK